MKLYLAHCHEDRHWIRDWELKFEEKNPEIELYNPFYDHTMAAIADIDTGRKAPADPSLPYKTIVLNDLDAISKADGAVFIVTKANMLGAFCELVEAFHMGKPIILGVIDDEHRRWHPWIRYYTNDNICTSMKQIEYNIQALKVLLAENIDRPVKDWWTRFD